MRYVYLDYAATQPLLPEVADRMTAVMRELSAGRVGNAAALHDAGQYAQAILEEARQEVADLIGAEPSEIIFTSGGSEANNTVMNIFRGARVAVSAIEHPSVLESAKRLAGEVVVLPVDEWGFVESKAIPEVDLVSVMLANNELGTLPLRGQAVEEVSFHVDATQALGKIPVNVRELKTDYLTLSAHKIGGPVGIGALYVRTGAKYENLIWGGHQERGRRAGTSNVLLAAGLAEAVKSAKRNLKRYAEVAKIRDELKRRILAEVPYASCNTPEEDCLPNILNMSFQAAEGEAIQLYLANAGIMVSTGSACASGDAKPSHVHMATRNDAEIAHSSVRFSLGPKTTRADVDYVMTVLPDIIRRLQGMSTVKIKEEK